MTDELIHPNRVETGAEEKSVSEDNSGAGYADLYGMYATDSKAESEGIRMQFGERTFMTLARAGGSNKRFQKTAEMYARPHRQAIERGAIDPEVVEGILRQTYADSVVMGWEGILDPKSIKRDPVTGQVTGTPLPFTRDNVLYLFKALPELFDDVKDKATNAGNFRAGDIAADLGN